jgi:hypothetical protein
MLGVSPSLFHHLWRRYTGDGGTNVAYPARALGAFASDGPMIALTYDGGMSMRLETVLSVTVAPALIVLCTSLAGQVAADDAPFDGTWKFVQHAPSNQFELAIIKVSQQDGKTAATVVDATRMLGETHVKRVECTDGALTITLTTGSFGETQFRGKLSRNGGTAGKILGTSLFRDELYPAHLETTTRLRVGESKSYGLDTKLDEVQRADNPRDKIKLLEQAIEDNNGLPSSQMLYSELLKLAHQADLKPPEVREVIKRWVDEAKPFGDDWQNEVRIKALNAISKQKQLSGVALDLAQQVDKLMSDNAAAKKVAVMGILARAARELGMPDVAQGAEARAKTLEHQADDEYHQKAPPFKPSPYDGRMNKQADQVVLMELFTGAQCAPCVAADFAFNALLKTYKSAEFIGLQYHVHIPRPDPMTNTDSLARQRYYGVKRAPTFSFSGRSEAVAGGRIGQSAQRYQQCRAIIEKGLEGSRAATIAVSANRTGDHVKIVASGGAQSRGAGPNGDRVEPVAKERRGNKANLMLRLALTEEEIRYVGANKLRFHHHVVRAFPGGTEGRKLEAGSAKVEVSLNIAELKRDLERELSDFAKDSELSSPLPEIKLDKLAVVAFVQDDDDKSILHAVSVPVQSSGP